jgi:RNA polymerase sigma factor (sigma-70 family)
MERVDDDIRPTGFRVTDKEFKNSFKELFKELHPKLLFFASRGIRDLDDARDVVLEKWTEILSDHTRSFPSKKAFSNYMFNGVRMRIIHYQRSKMEEVRLKKDIGEMEADFDSPSVFRNERFMALAMREVYVAIDELPRRQKEAILGVLAEKSFQEIAADMRATEAAVRLYVSRAKAALGERFAGRNLEVIMALIALGIFEEMVHFPITTIQSITT